MKYKFSLTTQSMLLTGSGEGSVLIDSDVVFHSSGFPFIPAKRVKGMLKESLEEVLEIYGKPEPEIKKMVAALFGESKKQIRSGKLLFGNLFVEDWERISDHLKNVRHPAFEAHHIKSFFTTEIQQTAIDENGVAEDRSLRNYRVIEPDHTFEGIFSAAEPLDKQELEYFQKAVTHLRYAGTRRNRGFGKIACRISELIEKERSAGASIAKSPGTSDTLAIEITTASPVVLAQQLGEQNTVFTRKYIPGNRIRGLLAGAYIRQKGLDRKGAHLDPGFRDIFLSGKVRFDNLFYNQGEPIPLYIQEPKVQSKPKKVISLFHSEIANDLDEEDEKEEQGPRQQTRTIEKLGRINKEGIVQLDGYNPVSSFFFHNSRENRAAGRSKENDTAGGIFYYEALEADQTFTGQISGPPALLRQLSQALPAASFTARLGRSKSAQYGEVEVALKEVAKANSASRTYPAGDYVLVVQSPLLLFNEFGCAVPDVTHLMKSLNELFPDAISLKRAMVAFTTIEQYNTTWASKSGKHAAFKEGSAFLLHLSEPVSVDRPLGFLGEWNERGFGKVKLEPHKPTLHHRFPEENFAAAPAGPPKTEEIKIPILEDIVRAYDQELLVVEIKTKAIRAAQKYIKQLNNHLISRMERLFQQSRDANDINAWIEQAKGKVAGEALQKAGLIKNDTFDLNQVGRADFKSQKRYWITFFQTLRKMNKSNDL